MASRKEEQARRRAERLEAERRAAESNRRRTILGYVVAGLLSAAVIAGIVVALSSGGAGGEQVEGEAVPEEAGIELQSGDINGVRPDGREGTPPAPVAQADLEVAAKQAGCELQLDLEDEGNTHVTGNFPDYKTNPPTSGNHHPIQQADGAYAEEVPEPNAVHSMEHGRLEIQYSPDLPESEQLELKGLFDEDPGGLLLFPKSGMPYEVAATSWTKLLGCPRYKGAATIDALRAFRDTYRGQGPEPVPIDF